MKQTSGAEPVLLFLVSPPLLLLVLVYFLVISLFFHLTGSGPCHLATNNKYSCNMRVNINSCPIKINNVLNVMIDKEILRHPNNKYCNIFLNFEYALPKY